MFTQSINAADAAQLTPMVLTAGQVAHLLGRSETTFKRDRLELEDLGFPQKLPGLNKWSRAAVTRWIETNGKTYEPAAPDAALQDVTRQLEAEYGQ